MAAICPEVGAGFSTGSSPIFVGLPDEDEDELELLFVFNLFVRLHAATTRTRAIIASTFFIGSFILPGSETQTPSYDNREKVSNEFPQVTANRVPTFLAASMEIISSL